MNYLQNYSTERLFIRPLEKSDCYLWDSYFENNENLKFLNLNNELTNAEKSVQWIDNQIRRYNNNLYGLMALFLKDTNVLIGQCGLLTQELEGRLQLEIGYHIKPEYWHQGFATEAAKFFKQLAFDHKLSEEIISIINIDNIGSQKVARNNGMTVSKQIIYKSMPVYIYSTHMETS